MNSPDFKSSAALRTLSLRCPKYGISFNPPIIILPRYLSESTLDCELFRVLIKFGKNSHICGKYLLSKSKSQRKVYPGVFGS